MLALAGVITTLHLSGEVSPDGGDYLEVAFSVPVGTVELQVAHDDGSADQILDWGVWSPEGFRGWGGGLTDPAVIGIDGSSRGYLQGPITPGIWQVELGKAKLDGIPGHYTIDIEFRDAATLPAGPTAPWQPVTLSPEPRWYAGDFHVHSIDSGDATATIDQITALARARGLDFVELSDHNTTAQIPHLTAAQAALTDLLLMRGAEVTTYGGHGNAIGVGVYIDHRVGYGPVNAWHIVGDVHDAGGVFAINHPVLDLNTACIGCAWSYPDTPWDQVSAIEIQTGNADLTGALFTPRAIAFWDAQLAAGYHIAAIGGSDDHRAGMEMSTLPARIGSPTTMVYASALSEAAIVAGIAGGRTVVKMRGPDDPMVELRAFDGARNQLGVIGDDVYAMDSVDLEADVGAGGDGMVAELWQDGVKVDTQVVAGGRAEFRDQASGPDVTRFRIELTQDGQRVTVTSHLYLHGPGEGRHTCVACTSGGGAASAVLPCLTMIGLAIVLRRRRAM